jgi:hypothetical protein
MSACRQAQQRQQAHVDLGRLCLDEVAVLRPFGIGKLDSIGQDACGAAQFHVQPAGDFEVAAGLFTHVAVQRATQQIPGKENDKQGEQQQQHEQARNQFGPQQVCPGGRGSNSLIHAPSLGRVLPQPCQYPA